MNSYPDYTGWLTRGEVSGPDEWAIAASLPERYRVAVVEAGESELIQSTARAVCDLRPGELCLAQEQGVILLLDEAATPSQRVGWLLEALLGECFVQGRAGISQAVKGLEAGPTAWGQAVECLTLQGLYEPGAPIAAAEDMALARLVQALPLAACRGYYQSLGGGAMAALREDDVATLAGMVQNNLGLMATAQAMYLHRNTLQNRLDRIRDVTGLDPRSPRDCAQIQLWLMIRRRLERNA